MPADSKKSSLERVSLVWRFEDGPGTQPAQEWIRSQRDQLQADVKALGEYRRELLALLDEYATLPPLADIPKQGPHRELRSAVATVTKEIAARNKALAAFDDRAAEIGEFAAKQDARRAISKANTRNAEQPRDKARLISPADAKEKWKEFLRQGSPELAAVKFTEYFGDPDRYEPESPPSKRTIARALKAVGYIQQK